MNEKEMIRRSIQEQIILLVLGEIHDKEMSMLHLQKEIFLLWKSYQPLQKHIEFTAYKTGPYSEELDDVIRNPWFSLWECKEGVKLTKFGKDIYPELYKEYLVDEEVLPILAMIHIVRRIYDEYSPEELIDLICKAYPEYKSVAHTQK